MALSLVQGGLEPLLDLQDRDQQVLEQPQPLSGPPRSPSDPKEGWQPPPVIRLGESGRD